jgi:hypothetical protein
MMLTESLYPSASPELVKRSLPVLEQKDMRKEAKKVHRWGGKPCLHQNHVSHQFFV